jgi:predicted HAD superfamily Cof-like phosphohydrolase
MVEFTDKEVLGWAVHQLTKDHGANAYVDRIAKIKDKLSPNLPGDIKAFHEKFELAYEGPPRWLPGMLSEFRSRFLEEEILEYRTALTLEGKFDALVDLVYVAIGTAHLHGFPFDEAWRRVHKANMSKVRGASERSASYDVVKPPNFVPPDLTDLVNPGETDD